MLSEKAIADIETIGKIIEKRNQSEKLRNKNVSLLWTFMFNDSCYTNASGYFCVWVGKAGRDELKEIMYGLLDGTETLLQEMTDDKILEIVNRNEKRYCLVIDKYFQEEYYYGELEYKNKTEPKIKVPWYYSYEDYGELMISNNLTSRQGFENYLDALFVKIKWIVKKWAWFRIEKFKDH